MACERNIPYLFGKIHEIHHKAPIEVYRRKICFLYGELFLLNRRDDGLCERLGILLLNHSLNVFAIDLLGSGIVLLVLV